MQDTFWVRWTRLLLLSMLLAAALSLNGARNCSAVILAWDANDPAPYGYTLYWGVYPENYTNSMDVPGDALQAEVTGLATNEMYYFAVTAYTIDGSIRNESGYSNEVVCFNEQEVAHLATHGSLRWFERGAMAITFSKVQSATASSSAPTQITFSSGPTEGNLLMVFCMERSGGDPADFTISGTGWTKRLTQEIDISDSIYRQAMAVWTKVAGASEPSSVSVSDTSGTTAVMGVEYQAGEAVTWTFEDSASNNGGKNDDVTTISTGTTGSVPAGNLLVISIAGIKEWNAAGVQVWGFETAGTDDSFDDTGSGLFGRIIATAFRQESASGTYSDDTDQISGTLSNKSQMAGMLVFSASSATSGNTYQETAADSFKFNDLPITKASMYTLANDSLAIGETPLNLLSLLTLLNDGIDVSDVSSVNINMGIQVSNGLALSDNQTTKVVLVGNCLDNIVASDTSVNDLHITLMSQDQVSLLDTLNSNLLFINSIADRFKLGDSSLVGSNALYVVVATDGIKLQDTLSILSNMFSLSTDDINLSDNLISNLNIQSVAIDGISLTDVTIAILSLLANSSDSIKLSESSLSELFNKVLSLVVNDRLMLNDNISTIISLLSQISDRSIFTDNATPVSIIKSVITDGVKLSDVSIKSLTAVLTALDGMKLGDTDNINATFNIQCTDTVQFNSVLSSIMTLFTLVIDTFNLSDSGSYIIVEPQRVEGKMSITVKANKSIITVLVSKPKITATTLH